MKQYTTQIIAVLFGFIVFLLTKSYVLAGATVAISFITLYFIVGVMRKNDARGDFPRSFKDEYNLK